MRFYEFVATCGRCQDTFRGCRALIAIATSWSAREYSWLQFCPRCYFQLMTPRKCERRFLRRYLEDSAFDENGVHSPFRQNVTDLVERSIPDGSFYAIADVPRPVVDCPQCRIELELWDDDELDPLLICRSCNERTAEVTFTGLSGNAASTEM